MAKARLYIDEYSFSSRLRRLCWSIVSAFFFRPTPNRLFNRWRLGLLRAFGAKIGHGCRVAPSCKIWAPWNLRLGMYACLADDVDCYSVDIIELHDYATVSQRAFLCTASHDIRKLERPLTHRPILIEAHAWVCAEAFIGPGVVVSEGAVVSARAVVFKAVNPWKVVGGNPAVELKTRIIS